MDSDNGREYRGPMFARRWLAPLVWLTTHCQPTQSAHPATAIPDPDGSVERPGAAARNAPIGLEWFDIATNVVDPRFSGLPSRLSEVELTPRTTLMATLPRDTRSARFSIDGRTRLDTEAPFFLTEDVSGSALDWPGRVGQHRLVVTGYGSNDGSGSALASRSVSFEVTPQRPATKFGAHSQHRFWITGSDQYVVRSATGNFATPEGEVVISANDITLEEPEKEQGRFVSKNPNADTIEFAFILLVPENYDPEARYPLLTFLHHGWDVFRGTDNDGRVLRECPLFSGPRSLIHSNQRVEYPAIVLVPQMIAKETIGGIENEWAAFTDLDNEKGTVTSAPHPSRSATYVLRVVDDLVNGRLSVDGVAPRIDSGRLYLAGHSMGGLGTWDLLARKPNLWAAGVPMAGYPDHSRAARLKAMPIWAFHHALDCYNPVQGTRTMFELIQRAAGAALRMRYTELAFDTAGQCDQAHFQTPAEAWNHEPDLFEWLFGQARRRRVTDGATDQMSTN